MSHASKVMRHKLLLFVLVWLMRAEPAYSQPLIEIQQDLDFGTLAIADNNLVSQLNYPQNGNNISITGGFVLIANGTTGRYRFTGFPAFTTLDISLNNTTLSAGNLGISEDLIVDSYDFTDPTTNAQGEAEMSLGARLSTSGNGSPYADAQYTGTTLLRASYWQPLVNSFVTNTRIVQIVSELRSSLTISEVQPLHFGTLFARTSNTNQASLSLSPTGTFSISEPGDSRLISLGNPDQGVLRVSGAAPNYSLTVSPQLADVLLEHTDTPGSAPHFILSALLSSPDGIGTSDANGELLISIGGTLKTELTVSPIVYPSGRYEGTYQLTVSY